MPQGRHPSGPVVLVTGATGFTGSHLVRSLVEDGYRVRVLSRSAQRAAAVLPREVEIMVGEANDPSSVNRAVEGSRVIYHLAAAYREAKHSDQYYRDVNIGFTSLLLDAARRAAVDRFVHCSTVGVLSHIANPPADEQHPHQPADIYQATKSQAEKLAISAHQQHGTPVTVARPTAIYGPGDTRLLKMFRMIAERRFVMLGFRDIYYHMVHVQDLVAGLRMLGEHPRAVGEVFILGGEKYYKLTAIVEMIARAVGVRPPRLRLPALPFQVAGTICEKICIPLGIEPPIYRRRIDFFTKSRAFTIEKASRLLGYAPAIELEAGIRSTVAWYRSHGYLPQPAAPLVTARSGTGAVNPNSRAAESADVETSTEDYASRFKGAVGKWFLELQTRTTLDLLKDLPGSASVLDVGGGHAQLTPDLVWAGYDVVVVGSHPSCDARLKPWLGRNCRFNVADLHALPYEDQAFDAVVCFRLLPHSVDWIRLVAELCRVARRSVVVDYPSVRSINVVSERLYSLKKRIEKNTRPFTMFHPREVRAVFEANGFLPAEERPQFLFPMVLHRWSNSARLSRLMEGPASRLGLTRRLGSPIVLRADRSHSRAIK